MLTAGDLTATGVTVNKQFLNVTYSPFICLLRNAATGYVPIYSFHFSTVVAVWNNISTVDQPDRQFSFVVTFTSLNSTKRCRLDYNPDKGWTRQAKSLNDLAFSGFETLSRSLSFSTGPALVRIRSGGSGKHAGPALGGLHVQQESLFTN